MRWGGGGQGGEEPSEGSPFRMGSPLGRSFPGEAEGIFPFGGVPFEEVKGVSLEGVPYLKRWERVPHLWRISSERWIQVPFGENPFGGSPHEEVDGAPPIWRCPPESGQRVPFGGAEEVPPMDTSEREVDRGVPPLEDASPRRGG